MSGTQPVIRSNNSLKISRTALILSSEPVIRFLISAVHSLIMCILTSSYITRYAIPPHPGPTRLFHKHNLLLTSTTLLWKVSTDQSFSIREHIRTCFPGTLFHEQWPLQISPRVHQNPRHDPSHGRANVRQLISSDMILYTAFYSGAL